MTIPPPPTLHLRGQSRYGLSMAVPLILALLAGPIAGFLLGRRRSPPTSPEADVIAPLSDPVLLLRDARIAAANPAARRLLGDWIEGQDVRLALRHPAIVERLTRSAPPPHAEAEQIEVTGIGETDRKWLVTLAPLPGGARLVQLTDRSEAAAAERMRVDFVANASHELRTPLASVLGFVETLQDDEAGGDPALRARFLRLMDEEAKRMRQLIDDLMSLSRIEAERFNPPQGPVDLASLVEEVRASCAQLLAERRCGLTVEPASAATIVAGDRAQLLQLIRNLVVNALRYGHADSEVTVRFEDEGTQAVRLTVADQGEGIAPEHLPRLTERFYRADPGRSRSLGGTGLGLAIAKHIVTRHRGHLDIRSQLGVGTSVAVSLPRWEERPES
jgi:two-component system phosphate regulon sensor histidine kinase PhoR